MCYWATSPDVAISKICAKAGASKPGLYREFGSDDGLKEAVLSVYGEIVSTRRSEILASEQPFSEVLEALITYTIQDRRALGLPDGCLLFAMRARRDEFGPLTRKKIDQLRLDSLEKYRQWIDRAKANGEFRADMSTETAALYLDAQAGNAMRLQKEGISNEVIGEILRTAFSAL
ncbi:TetR/AcrR family transcriptional regulator [Candidatus Njordibacter sp. Uisw_056]|uniref:TetR/AcrR family transcriptional regulator n=1 Tax=Candidatus Njordibacter sp. Uisw_056 TaxID=3230973 RepID=UPI003D598FD4